METLGMANSAIDHYLTLTRSPLLLTPIIESFYQTSKPSEKNILLGYLILPLALYPASKEFLKKANKASSIRTLCSERSRIAGLPQRINELRSISSIAIQNSVSCGRLIIHSDLSLMCKDGLAINNHGMVDEQKASKRLATMFAPYDIPTIYRLLGVTKL